MYNLSKPDLHPNTWLRPTPINWKQWRLTCSKQHVKQGVAFIPWHVALTTNMVNASRSSFRQVQSYGSAVKHGTNFAILILHLKFTDLSLSTSPNTSVQSFFLLFRFLFFLILFFANTVISRKWFLVMTGWFQTCKISTVMQLYICLHHWIQLVNILVRYQWKYALQIAQIW